MRNFRQHAESEIHFRPGLTGIIGANGAGKSTILEVVAGLLVLVNLKVPMILFWLQVLEPTYERNTPENQSYGFEENRPQDEPGGLDNERRFNERPNE